MKKLEYVQLYKDNKELCLVAQTLWIDFLREVNANDGKKQTEEQKCVVLNGVITQTE